MRLLLVVSLLVAAPRRTTPQGGVPPAPVPSGAVPLFDRSHPEALPSPRSNAELVAPSRTPAGEGAPPAPVPGALRGGAPPPPRTVKAIGAELTAALVGTDSSAATRLLAEAAALGEMQAAQCLYESLDGAHGKLFKNRRGRHAGLGPNEVEGYSSMAEQRSLRGFFHQADVKTICETGFNAGHSAANYLLANFLGYGAILH